MVSIKRCNCCREFFDVDPQNPSSLCESCKKLQEVVRKRDLWGEDIYEETVPAYYMPRYSGTLSFIERDGESAPEILEDEKLDRLMEGSVSEYHDTRQGEAESILAAFSKTKNTEKKTAAQKAAVKPAKSNNKEENTLLAKLFGSMEK